MSGREKTRKVGHRKVKLHNDDLPVKLSDADGHVHQAEHRVFEFDGVETLLPVPYCRVDVEPAGRWQENSMRGSAAESHFDDFP